MSGEGIERVRSEGLAGLRDAHCTLGIDEAGRGPVLGPMVYGGFVCLSTELDRLKKEFSVADSKALSEEKRESIFDRMTTPESQTWLAYGLEVISAHHITTNMLARHKVSLNDISHSAAISLIQMCSDFGIVVDHVYVDTVGPPETYQAKLQRIFPRLDITVSKKADSLFPVVSAASICAKVTRDRLLRAWSFEGDGEITIPEGGIGSGYPADPATRSFLESCLDPVFGFPSVVRASWSTAEQMLLKRGGWKLGWPDEEEEEGNSGSNSRSLTDFFASKSTNDQAPIQRCSYFLERHVKNCQSL